MVWRMSWILVVTVALSYVTYLFGGSIVHARAAGLYEPVIVRDVEHEGAHHLSGMVMVPSPCDQLSVRTEALSETMYMLNFNTWREPSVDCNEEQTPRIFHAILFPLRGPITLGALLDGATLPIVSVSLPAPSSAIVE